MFENKNWPIGSPSPINAGKNIADVATANFKDD